MAGALFLLFIAASSGGLGLWLFIRRGRRVLSGSATARHISPQLELPPSTATQTDSRVDPDLGDLLLTTVPPSASKGSEEAQHADADVPDAADSFGTVGTVGDEEPGATGAVQASIVPTSAVENEPVAESPVTDGISVPRPSLEKLPDEDLDATNAASVEPLVQGAIAIMPTPEEGVGPITSEPHTDTGHQADPVPPTDEGVTDEVAAPTRQRPAKRARHSDRRGQRRAVKQPVGTPREPPVNLAPTVRPPAEAKLRLFLHPVRRSVGISVVLARPSGYPDRITVIQETPLEVGAYSESRYDDIDLEWTRSLLSGEIRLNCEEGYQWLRSSRRLHIFSEVADEPGLMSVSFATTVSPCTIVCREEEADTVRLAAKLCGSQELFSYAHWTGVPKGWEVLSGYQPTQAASTTLETGLTGLDPGIGATISLSGDFQIRSGFFAEGNPPRIEITPFPVGASVTIDGMPAKMEEDGSWRVDGWDAPGDHLIDVVPGPSATYRIVGDPWSNGGWEIWDAHPARFPTSAESPWARVVICGAMLSGPLGEHVVAAETMATVIALGLWRGAATLSPRPDAPVSIGLLAEAPAFLILASGPRRAQGNITWIASSESAPASHAIDQQWLAAVRSAASKRLPLTGADAEGQDAWRRARKRARCYRKPAR